MYTARELNNMSTLPRRAQEVIAWFDLKHPLTSMDEEEVIDVGQNLGRVPRAIGACPCVTSGSQLWLRKRRRMVEGVEALMLQGVKKFPHSLIEDLFVPANYYNLAGNAFCAYSAMAVQVGMLASYTWPTPE